MDVIERVDLNRYRDALLTMARLCRCPCHVGAAIRVAISNKHDFLAARMGTANLCRTCPAVQATMIVLLALEQTDAGLSVANGGALGYMQVLGLARWHGVVDESALVVQYAGRPTSGEAGSAIYLIDL